MAQVTHGSDIEALQRLAEEMLTHAELTLVDILTNGPELAQVAAVVAAGGRGALAMTTSQYALVSSMIAAVRPIGGEVVRVAGHAGSAVGGLINDAMEGTEYV